MKSQFDKDYFYGKRKSNYSNYEKMDFQRLFKRAVDFFKQNNVRGRFLDIGCAFGGLTKLAVPFFDEVHGCDISDFAIKRAKKCCTGSFRVVNIEKGLPYPNKYFDCITALDVLEHTSSIENSFNKIISKLKKNGFLLISLPIENRITKTFGFLDGDKTHTKFPREEEIMRLTRKYNMKVLKKDYFLPFPYFYKIYKIPVEIELYMKKLD